MSKRKPLGAEISAICTTCGRTSHVVASRIAGRVAQIQCTKCGEGHIHDRAVLRRPKKRTTRGLESEIVDRKGIVLHSGVGIAFEDFVADMIQSCFDLANANLVGVDLRGWELRGARLRGANLQGADLRDTDLDMADLAGASLTGATVRGASLCGANLSHADCRWADLSKGVFFGTDFNGADLRGANIRHADIRCARFGDTPRMAFSDLRFSRGYRVPLDLTQAAGIRT